MKDVSALSNSSAAIIDGKLFAENLRNRIAGQVKILQEKHRITPGLAVVLVGEDPASQVYVRNKAKQTKEVGMNSFEFVLPIDIGQKQLLARIEQLNKDPKVHGILVQLPLPADIDEVTVINAILPEKDVDGFHPVNIGRLVTGQSNGTVPCTPLGCLMLIKDTLGDLTGKKAVVIGRSNIVGKPMAQLLLNESCTVTIVHSKTKNIKEECRSADIIVAAVGRPEMVKADWVKPGAVVIDVGINRISTDDGKSKLVGDVAFEDVKNVASAITPVPGGVGPMTIACLLQNTLKATCLQKTIDMTDDLFIKL